MNDLISIIIPTYNRAHLLHRVINSVLDQTYSNWELLIVDDGSSDATKKQVTKYLSEKIRFIERPQSRPKGANACRNIGIEQARGAYIAFLDSDDIWLPQRLEKAWAFVQRSQASALYSGAMIHDGKRFFKRISRQIEKDESVFDFAIRFDTFAPTPSLILKRALAEVVKFDENLQRHQDFDFFIRLSQIENWIYFENWDVQVNWDQSVNKKLDYSLCIPFYQLHAHLSKDPTIRHHYIFWLSEKSVKENSGLATIRFFKKILGKEGYKFSIRQNLLFYFPLLFHLLYKAKRLLK